MCHSLEELLKSANSDVIVSHRIYGALNITLHYDNATSEWVVTGPDVYIHTEDLSVAVKYFSGILTEYNNGKR